MKVKTERQWNKNTLLKEGDFKNTKEMIERVARLIPERKIFATLDKDKNIVYHTAKQLLEDVERIGNAFLNLGFKDKHIAIIADNSYEYIITDMAVIGGVGVTTPIDRDAQDDLLITLINKCEAQVVCCSSFKLIALERIKAECPKLEQFITLDKKVEGYLYLKDLMAEADMQENAYRKVKIDQDAICQLLFTSGTTGPNKLVEIRHKNMAANITNCIDTVKGTNDETNTSMSVLPMHPATEINTHILPRIACGRLTYINDGMKTMMDNIKIFKPYVITIVPMIANMFYKTIWAMAKKNGMDGKLKKGIKLCKMLNKLGFDITHKLLKDVFKPFGGNLREIVCGGAALNPEVVKGLRDLGIFIINGFGITECGPLVSMNTETVKDAYSVGLACPKLQVKIDQPDDEGVGELCIKGESVSSGYYKDEQATAQVFDEKGFFHTGDYAKMDNAGRIFLSGRKKNTIVLENGKNVYPEEIETTLINSLGYLQEVVVYDAVTTIKGEDKKVICAGVLVDPAQPKTAEELKADFLKINATLPVYKRVQYIDVTDSEYEKTSTRKIKRDIASKRHAKEGGIII